MDVVHFYSRPIFNWERTSPSIVTPSTLLVAMSSQRLDQISSEPMFTFSPLCFFGWMWFLAHWVQLWGLVQNRDTWWSKGCRWEMRNHGPMSPWKSTGPITGMSWKVATKSMHCVSFWTWTARCCASSVFGMTVLFLTVNAVLMYVMQHHFFLPSHFFPSTVSFFSKCRHPKEEFQFLTQNGGYMVCKQVLHYFLGDDTIEILELNERNSGRMHFPMLIRRQKICRDTPHDLLSKLSQPEHSSLTPLNTFRTPLTKE